MAKLYRYRAIYTAQCKGKPDYSSVEFIQAKSRKEAMDYAFGCLYYRVKVFYAQYFPEEKEEEYLENLHTLSVRVITDASA